MTVHNSRKAGLADMIQRVRLPNAARCSNWRYSPPPAGGGDPGPADLLPTRHRPGHADQRAELLIGRNAWSGRGWWCRSGGV